jgi:1-acyl-sn-glycerol-3-phosphate acyltransferase
VEGRRTTDPPVSRMPYFLLKHIFLGPLLRLLYRLRGSGMENVPRTGPCVLAANHLSFVDSLFMPLLCPRPVVFLGRAEFFDHPLTGWLMRAANVIPVRREGGGAGEAAIRAGLEALRQGKVVGIYPEGTRSPDGRLYRGRTGVARLALEGRAPVIPVAIRGTDRVMPVDARLPRLTGPVEVEFGEPLRFDRYADRARDRFALRSITDEIMYEIMLRTGQEYADEYAGVPNDGARRDSVAARTDRT